MSKATCCKSAAALVKGWRVSGPQLTPAEAPLGEIEKSLVVKPFLTFPMATVLHLCNLTCVCQHTTVWKSQWPDPPNVWWGFWGVGGCLWGNWACVHRQLRGCSVYNANTPHTLIGPGVSETLYSWTLINRNQPFCILWEMWTQADRYRGILVGDNNEWVMGKLVQPGPEQTSYCAQFGKFWSQKK